jgi:hypothetical protein
VTLTGSIALIGAEKLNMLADGGGGGGPWFMAGEVAVAIAAIVERGSQSKSQLQSPAQNDTETMLDLAWGSDALLRFDKSSVERPSYASAPKKTGIFTMAMVR